jgi:AraC-like DNA-binding protein
MPIETFDASPALAGQVAGFWGLTVPADARPGSSHVLAPDGCIALISQRNARGDTRASLLGPRTDPLPLTVSPGDRIWAVRFWPDTGGRMLGVDPADLAGHFVTPLAEPAWAAAMLKASGASANREAAQRVFEQHLAPRADAARPVDEAVRAAVQALILTHGELSIAEVATGVGLSLRQLERRFLAAVGLNPVQYSRIRKLRGDLAPLLGDRMDWVDVASRLDEARA